VLCFHAIFFLDYGHVKLRTSNVLDDVYHALTDDSHLGVPKNHLSRTFLR
jgi:hypothetical protein